MTGVRADAAVDAGLETEGAQRPDLLHEALHGAGHASLRCTGLLRGREIGGEYADGVAHEVAPLRASR